jgi:hypothetical protein
MAKVRRITRAAMRKFIVRAMVAGLALFAAYISYTHIQSVVAYAGETVVASYIYPFLIDFMMVLASVFVFDDKRQRRKPRFYARLGQISGLAMSIAANLADAVIRHGNPLSYVVAVVPAFVLFVTSEMLMHSGVPLPLTAADRRRQRDARNRAAARKFGKQLGALPTATKGAVTAA